MTPKVKVLGERVLANGRFRLTLTSVEVDRDGRRRARHEP